MEGDWRGKKEAKGGRKVMARTEKRNRGKFTSVAVAFRIEQTEAPVADFVRWH